VSVWLDFHEFGCFATETSLERVWIHRMSVVLVPRGDDWAIMLAQVTPVHPK